MKRIFGWLGITAAVLSINAQPTVGAASNYYQNVQTLSVPVHNELLSQNQSNEFDYKDFDFWAKQCRVLENEQKYTEALAACEKVIALQPKKKNVEIWTA